MKHRINDPTINKVEVLKWINTTLNGNQTKIQSLGNGVVYCMLMNHFYPNSIASNKIIMMPRNNMDNKTNLKKLQQALNLLNIKSIPFDIFRVSEMPYLDNWQLISKFYKHFTQLTKYNEKQQEKQNHQNQSQLSTNLSITQGILHPQINFTFSKQVPKTPDFSAGLLTPMKGLKFFEENTKMRYQALRLMQEIKIIVKSESQSDKVKVKNLKRMLGLIEEQSQQQEWEMKELFSDCRQKQQIITID